MRRDYYLKDVVTLKLNSDKCTGCGLCTVVCPHGVFGIKEKKAFIFDRDACMECGACVQNCPFGAIEVNSGVGCAAAIIQGKLAGTEPTCGDSGCGCSQSSKSCC